MAYAETQFTTVFVIFGLNIGPFFDYCEEAEAEEKPRLHTRMTNSTILSMPGGS